jgi:hypothetical protein
MTIHPLIQDAAFDPEAVALMGAVYESARKQLGAGQSALVLETVARRILEAGRRGERDPDKLMAFALRGLDSRGDRR